MMIAPTERYTPPLITFISFLISFTSFRRLFFSSLVISDLFILLISSRRCVNTSALVFSVLLVSGVSDATAELAGNAIAKSKTNDAMTFVIKQDDVKKQSFVTNENLATKTNYGISLNVPIPVMKKWMISTNVNYFVNRYEGKYLGEDLDLKIPVLNLNIQNRFTLPKDWSAELSGFYVSRAVQGLFVGSPLWAMNAGISKQLLNKRLSLRLNAQDIFWTQKFTGSLKFQNVDVKVRGYNDSRQVRFTATYRFGNQKVQQARRRSTGAEDEQNRIQKNG